MKRIINNKFVYEFTLLALIFTMTSCVSGPKNYYYEYQDTRADTEKGRFSMVFKPKAQLKNVDGQEVEVWGEPYHFTTQYFPNNETVLSGDINNLKIISEETGEVIVLADTLIDAVRRYESLKENINKQKKHLGFGVDGLIIPYHDYFVSFDYIIHKSKNVIFEQGNVEIKVDTNFYKARRREGVGIL